MCQLRSAFSFLLDDTTGAHGVPPRSRGRRGCWAKTRANRSSTTKTKTDARARSHALAPRATNPMRRRPPMQRATLLKSRGVDYREPRPPRRRPCTIEAQMIEDFEHPICWNCLGATMVAPRSSAQVGSLG